MSELVADLRQEGILSHISPSDLETLKYYGVFGEYGPGEVVVQEGVEQSELYIVIAGDLEVVIKSGGEEVTLGKIGPGDCIGEISIFEPGPASATVRVLEQAVLWHLDVTSLQSYFERLPVAGGQLMLGIAQLLSKRLRQANQAIIANRMIPKHLSVRSGKVEPITADNVDEDNKEKRTGLLGGLFKKDKPGGSKISTDIKI
jgi:CRP-like cAMP-binding protein